jgi:predicted nucleic acid-binding protein
LKLIDANVFLYAEGRDHVYHEPSLRFLAGVRDGQLAANTDTEVLQELIHFFRSRRQVQEGAAVVRDVLDTFPHCFPITASTIAITADVISGNPHLQARDAIHAAVVLEHGLEGIVSADKGFDAVDGIKRFDPREF